MKRPNSTMNWFSFYPCCLLPLQPQNLGWCFHWPQWAVVLNPLCDCGPPLCHCQRRWRHWLIILKHLDACIFQYSTFSLWQPHKTTLGRSAHSTGTLHSSLSVSCCVCFFSLRWPNLCSTPPENIWVLQKQGTLTLVVVYSSVPWTFI